MLWGLLLLSPSYRHERGTENLRNAAKAAVNYNVIDLAGKCGVGKYRSKLTAQLSG
jgi:hypothetical protein